MIKNVSKSMIITKDYKLCKSFLSKLKGLMFSKQKKIKNLVFVFDKEKKIELHMWFVFFPIDVVLLNSEKKVVEVKANFKPFRFFSSKNKARYVLELYNGAIRENKIELKDYIEF